MPAPTPTEGVVQFRCGDGVTVPGEECDDGNLFGGDGCAADCTPETVLTTRFDPVPESVVNPTATSFLLTGRLTLALSQGGLVAIRLLEFDPQIVSGGYVCIRSVVSPQLFGPGNVGMGALSGADTSLNVLRITFAEQEWWGRSDRGPDGIICTNDDPGLTDAPVFNRQLTLALPPSPLGGCCGDCNGDRAVTVDEVLSAVNGALNSCPAPVR